MPLKHIHTGRVVGTGLSLGLTDGTHWCGLQAWVSTIGRVANLNTGFYNILVGANPTSGGVPLENPVGIGVTETEGKSGLKVVRDPNIIMAIKY